MSLYILDILNIARARNDPNTVGDIDRESADYNKRTIDLDIVVAAVVVAVVAVNADDEHYYYYYCYYYYS